MGARYDISMGMRKCKDFVNDDDGLCCGMFPNLHEWSWDTCNNSGDENDDA